MTDHDQLLALPEPAAPAEYEGYMPGAMYPCPATPDYYTVDQMQSYTRANLAARQSEAEAILLELLRTGEALPVDSIICYASTMTEYEPNRLAKEFNDALAAARAWRDSRAAIGESK